MVWEFDGSVCRHGSSEVSLYFNNLIFFLQSFVF